MRDIHCPKDIGFENTFSGEDCEKEQHYNNCYHCWSTALAKETVHSKLNACNFCEVIYPDAETKNIIFRKGKYSDFNRCIFITIDDEGKYYINVDPGDPYEIGYICDIKFCPYCGRRLAESEE